MLKNVDLVFVSVWLQREWKYRLCDRYRIGEQNAVFCKI